MSKKEEIKEEERKKEKRSWDFVDKIKSKAEVVNNEVTPKLKKKMRGFCVIGLAARQTVGSCDRLLLSSSSDGM